jgi:hypothetical protein
MGFVQSVYVHGRKGFTAVAVAASTVFGYFGWSGTLKFAELAMWGTVIVASGAVVLSLTAAHAIYKCHLKCVEPDEPVRVRAIRDGQHLLQNQTLVIISKASWIKVGMLLVLATESHDTYAPIGLIRVDTFTAERGFPQCTLFSVYTDMSSVAEYLRDQSRWNSLTISRDIQATFLEPFTS